jgi:hypothetical protein
MSMHIHFIVIQKLSHRKKAIILDQNLKSIHPQMRMDT